MLFKKYNVQKWMNNNASKHIDRFNKTVDTYSLVDAALHYFGQDGGEHGPINQMNHWIWDLAKEIETNTIITQQMIQTHLSEIYESSY